MGGPGPGVTPAADGLAGKDGDLMLSCVLLTVLGSAIAAQAGTDDLKVLTDADAANTMMTTYLNGQAQVAFDRRAAEIEKLTTPELIGERQQAMRAFFIEQLGGWPERTPLNARITGTLDADGYRVEKVVFESRPGLHVTATMYLPLSAPPYPAVLVPCGHSREAKAYENYQRLSILLARNGLAALCFDPIGQGERFQTLKPDGKPGIGGTLEHTHVGTSCMLVGINAASYFVWDGIRAIDYLVSRPDVDAKRIGCAGQSGGGTQTSYFMALDERIVAAAPTCFLTSLPRLLAKLGPQDAEQNIYGAIARGMGHGDYVLMRAPKPTLIGTKTGDFFSIEGSWETYREAKRLYNRLGFAERVTLIEDDGPHGLSESLRVGVVRWMRRWLLDIDDAITEPQQPVHTEEELRCTPDGQVLRMDGARSVFEINTELEAKLAPKRRAFCQQATPDELRAKVCELAGIRTLDALPEPAVAEAGVVHRDGYRIRKLRIEPEAGIVLPALLFEADGERREACLYLHGEDKAADAAPGGPIEQLVRAGRQVLAVDLRGIGETQGLENTKGWAAHFGADWQDVFRAYLLGQSYVGMRAEDALVCARFLASAGDGPPRTVHLVATDEATVPALHAAALEPQLFTSVRLVRALHTWVDVVRTPITRNQLVNAIHGALRYYDLPDLANLVPTGKLTVDQPMDATGQVLSEPRP